MSEQVQKVVDLLKQWTIGGPAKGTPVSSKASFSGPAERNYNLKNSKTGCFLQHEEQTYGINMGWTDDGEPKTGEKVARWFFTRQGAEGPIKYGEVCALGLGNKPSFVGYDERLIGINLSYRDAPQFEWKVLGGASGDVVKVGQQVALFNEKGGECLIFFDRTRGGDVGWPSSQTWWDQVEDALSSAARKTLLAAALKQLAL